MKEKPFEIKVENPSLQFRFQKTSAGEDNNFPFDTNLLNWTYNELKYDSQYIWGVIRTKTINNTIVSLTPYDFIYSLGEKGTFIKTLRNENELKTNELLGHFRFTKSTQVIDEFNFNCGGLFLRDKRIFNKVRENISTIIRAQIKKEEAERQRKRFEQSK